MENKLVSVIIPVYNGEEYIVRCVESIIKQRNFDVDSLEILLLDDGSRDNSLAVVEELRLKYESIIQVYTQSNVGVAKTRNKGIELAVGKYTVFVDQDDYLDDDYFSVFTKAAEEGQYDIVVGGYQRPDSNGKVLKVVDQPGTDYTTRYKVSAAWAKIHRTEFLQRNRILFYDNSFGEDIIFTLQQSSLTDSIKGINYTGYNWFWNENSVSNTDQRSLKNQSRIVRLIEEMTPYIRSESDSYYLLQTGVYYLLHSGRNARSEEFLQLYKSMLGVVSAIPTGVLSTRLFLFGPRGVALTTRLTIGLFVVLHNLKLIPIFANIYCKGIA